MEKMSINFGNIDIVVLSHIHGDHVGGLQKSLEVNHDVTVYLPKSFPKNFKDEIEGICTKVVEVDSSKKITSGIGSTGELIGPPKEQSLILSTKRGLVVITGCAHPGIVKIVETAKELKKGDVYLVMGGFHLKWASDEKLKSIVESFREMGVQKVSPTHCSGDRVLSVKRLYVESTS